jgi:predicted Fe-Mo cluster-binding NifX family protein
MGIGYDKKILVIKEEHIMKIAIPLAQGKLAMHFGHCEQFALLDVESGDIKQKTLLTPPPHEPGVLPKWLGELGANLIIAGGMGQKAFNLFSQAGITVITGAQSLPPEDLAMQYLSGTLVTGANLCDH